MTEIEMVLEQDRAARDWHRARFGVEDVVAETSQSNQEDRDGLYPDLDPRVVATDAIVKDERTFDAYRQREAWVLQPRVEVDLSHSIQ